MSPDVTWPEIALRLFLTAAASALIGLNRGERGEAAGLRTTMLVALAAALAMIECNLLLAASGKATNGFVNIDPMRLPLGILSGMGFLGGGVILRRGNMVKGVTTAATLWFVTVMGLCFGSGQLYLGVTALGMALAVLVALKWVDQHHHRTHKGALTLRGAPEITPERIAELLLQTHYHVIAWKMVSLEKTGSSLAKLMICDVEWQGFPYNPTTPKFIEVIAAWPEITSVTWRAE